MNLFDLIEKTEEKKEKVRKVRARDLQNHIRWIDEEMNEVQKQRKRYREIQKELMEAKDLDDEERRILEEEAKLYADADARYTELQEQKEKEYTILKKYKDSKFFISPRDMAILGGLALLGIYAISLDRDNPKALKIFSFLTKLFPIKF